MVNGKNKKIQKLVKIPSTTVARLPLYLRCLKNIQDEKTSLVSSFELARLSGHNAAQLRKDLSYLGEFGTRGVGYEVDELVRQISKWLGTASVRSVAVVGAGHLGQALCNYHAFINKGFKISALYDNDKDKVGKKVGEIDVKHISQLASGVLDGPIDIGVIAVPARAAQDVATQMVEAGVKSILNFAPAKIKVRKGICVRNLDFSTQLQIIGFHLASVEHGLTSECCD